MRIKRTYIQKMRRKKKFDRGSEVDILGREPEGWEIVEMNQSSRCYFWTLRQIVYILFCDLGNIIFSQIQLPSS